MEKHLKRWEIWWLASRPKTLPAAASPVIVGIAVATWEGYIQLLPALCALASALLLQIGANLANDVFDYQRGADTADRLGPLRVTQAGLLRPSQVLSGMWLVFCLAALIGVYLIWYSGWPVLLIGLAAIIAAISYTGGPFPLGYYGLGDLTVFIFFGPAAVWGTVYVLIGEVSWLAFWAALPIGLLITAILVVNNLRDIDTDRRVGKKTLAIRLGTRGARLEYLLCVVGAFLSSLGLAVFHLTPWTCLLTWLCLPLAFRQLRIIYKDSGRALNQALAGTGQLTLWYALSFAAGLLLVKLLA